MLPLLPRSRSVLVLLCVAAAAPVHGETLHDARRKMGCRFEISVVTQDRAAAQAAIDAAYAEIDRIDALISEWKPDSPVSEINRNAGVRPVVVPPELFRLVRRSLEISRLTSGAFDITWLSAGKLWDFKAQPPALPSPGAIAAALGGVGWRHVVLDEARQSVYLDDARTRIGFGGNGQGYAINRAAFVLKAHGIRDAVLDGSGDLLLLGHNERGTPWEIGIADPRHEGRLLVRLALTDTAVTTAGDYEKFFLLDGTRYCHILDPRTGWPADAVQSVTVIAPDAELADALDTGLFVLGPVEGLRLVNQLKGIECLMIDRDGQRLVSDNFKLERLAAAEPNP